MTSPRAILRIKFLTLAAAAFAAAGSHASPAGAAVFGRDNRTPLSSDRQALKLQIGTLTSSATGAVCSAFCLAPDIIATASHCLFGASEASRPALSSLQFHVGDDAASATAHIAGRAIGNEAQNIIAGTERLSLAPPIGAAQDWAGVKLDAPVCRAGGLTLTDLPRAAIDATRAADGVYQVAIHRDTISPDLQIDQACGTAADAPPAILARDFADWRAILFHTCDTGGGSSGSPMLIDSHGETRVVALNVGTYVAARGVPSAATGALPPRAPIANTAIDIQPLAAALRALQKRALLSSNNEIARVQRRLKKLSLYMGSETGRVDASLIAAVRTYERSRFQIETGLLTKDLLSDLELPPGFVANR